MPKQDSIEIEILENGVIRWTTSAVSAANHSNAEEFIKRVGALAGGETTRERRHDANGHHHHHHGSHSHEGHSH